jgi:hypothetical protein
MTSSRPFALDGAPLDAVKLIAAAMVSDHVDDVVQRHDHLAQWCVGPLAGRPRFLSRYALYAFYPLHRLALIGWRALG